MDPPLKALLSLGVSDGVKFVIAKTGNIEGDARSKRTAEEITRLVGHSAQVEIVEVPLADLASGLETLLESVGKDDTILLAGGPRVLNILLFVVGLIKRLKVYAVPEYGGALVDLSSLSVVMALPCIDELKASLVTNLSAPMTQSDLAKVVGKHQATVSRNLEKLILLGLVKEVGGRPKRYVAERIALSIAKFREFNC